MTRILRLVALTAAVAAAGSSLPLQAYGQHRQAAPAETAAGKWNLSVETPHGLVPMTMTLKADGENVSGEIVSERGTRAVRGTFKAGTLTMVSTDDESNVWNVSARLAHGALKGHISASFGDMAFTAERGTAN